MCDPIELVSSEKCFNYCLFSLVQALLDILCLDGLVVATMYSWYPINKLATMLMVPYLAWLAMATCLTYVIWMDNPEKKPRKKE